MNLDLFYEIIKIIHFLTVFVLFLFSIFLITRKKGNKISHYLLAGFLLSSAIILIDKINLYYYVEQFSPHLWNIGYPFIFFFSPMLYLYTRSFTNTRMRLRWIDSLHFIPFISLYIICFLALYRFDAQSKLDIIRHYDIYLLKIDQTSKLLYEIQFIIYTLLSLYILFQYRKRIKEYYSNTEKMNLSWLNFVLIGFIIWRAFYMFLEFWNLPPYQIHMQILTILVESGLLFFASALVYKGLTMPVIFTDQSVYQKYQTSPLSETDKECFLRKIDMCMKEEKPYLDSLFTLSDLSKRTAIPLNYVSQVLNEKLNKKFYDYVNFYRIEEVKRNLSDPSHLDKTITEIFYNAGFNSKSVFNKAFKKLVGKTPGEFREEFQK